MYKKIDSGTVLVLILILAVIGLHGVLTMELKWTAEGFQLGTTIEKSATGRWYPRVSEIDNAVRQLVSNREMYDSVMARCAAGGHDWEYQKVICDGILRRIDELHERYQVLHGQQVQSKWETLQKLFPPSNETMEL